MREMGERIYQAKARIMAGESESRALLRKMLARLAEDDVNAGVDPDDFDDLLARNDRLATTLIAAEECELQGWVLLDEMRRVIEEMTSDLR